jgi:hypothetical protein
MASNDRIRSHGLSVPLFLFSMGCTTLFLAGCSPNAAHIKRGDELLKGGLHEEALEEYEKSAELAPDDPQVRTRILQTRKTISEKANAEGLATLEQKDEFAALLLFKKAIQFNPEEPEYKKNLKKAADALVAASKKSLGEKKAKEAVELLRRIKTELPKYQPALQALKEAEEAMVRVLYEEAKAFQEKSLLGNALISLMKIKKLFGAFQDSATREIEVREELQSSAIFKVKAQAFKVSKRWAETTSNWIHRLKDTKLPKCPNFALSTARQERISLNVGLENVAFSETKETTQGKQKYQSGTQKVDNPKYGETENKIESDRKRVIELEQLLKDGEVKLEELRQRFADAGPDDDDASLRQRLKEAEQEQAKHLKEKSDTENEETHLREVLASTPKKLNEPVYSDYNYPVLTVQRTATAHAKVLLMGEGGLEIFNKPLSGSASTQDKTNQAFPKYHVAADPLSFPKSDDVLMADAVGRVFQSIVELLDQECQRWQAEILSAARQGSRDAKIEATEDFILYLFVSPENPDPEAVKFLKEQCGVLDIDSLLGKEAPPAKEAPAEIEAPAEKDSPRE